MNQSAFNPIPAQHVQSVAHLHRVPHIQPLRPNFIPPSPQNISPSLGSHRQIPPRQRIQPRVPVVKRESLEQRTQRIQQQRNQQRVLQQQPVVQRHEVPYHPPVAQPGYVNHDHYDHFYQDMTFKAHIIRWTTAQTGEIRIDGVDGETVIFKISDINNIHGLNPKLQFLQIGNSEIAVPVTCKVGNNKTECFKYSYDITIHPNELNGFSNSNNSNGFNPSQRSSQRLRGIVDRVPTPKIDGIAYCIEIDKAVRIPYTQSTSLFTRDQAIYFEHHKITISDASKPNEFDVKHIAKNVTATVCMSPQDVRRDCVNSIGKCTLNSKYFIENLQLDLREDQYHEFKHRALVDMRYGNDIKKVVNVILKNVNAFINHKGGILFVGIEDNGNIRGIGNITRFVEDRVRTSISNSLFHWRPRKLNMLNKAYRVEFVSVARKEKEDERYYVLPNTKVIVITVKPVFQQWEKRQVLWRTGYEHQMKTFQRNDAGVSERAPFDGLGGYKGPMEVVDEEMLEFELRKCGKRKREESVIDSAHREGHIGDGHRGDGHNRNGQKDGDDTDSVVESIIPGMSPEERASDSLQSIEDEMKNGDENGKNEVDIESSSQNGKGHSDVHDETQIFDFEEEKEEILRSSTPFPGVFEHFGLMEKQGPVKGDVILKMNGTDCRRPDNDGKCGDHNGKPIVPSQELEDVEDERKSETAERNEEDGGGHSENVDDIESPSRQESTEEEYNMFEATKPVGIGADNANVEQIYNEDDGDEDNHLEAISNDKNKRNNALGVQSGLIAFELQQNDSHQNAACNGVDNYDFGSVPVAGDVGTIDIFDRDPEDDGQSDMDMELEGDSDSCDDALF